MRFFFILALGRSGTNFLAGLLGNDRRGRVLHEPYRLDPQLMVLRRAGGFDSALDQMLSSRFEELLPPSGSAEFYGEVNSYLRYEADWLCARFDPTLIHLVRDGRDFVRSAYIRGVYTPHEIDGPVVPRDDDPFAGRWAEMTRFQRICWYWMHTNEYLASRVERCVRFEDLLRDYETLRKGILEPTGVQVPEAVWRAEIDRPKNTSRRYRIRLAAARLLRGRKSLPRFDPLPHWSDWEDERVRQFREICAPTMRRFGYED
jgi:hypothetical protein